MQKKSIKFILKDVWRALGMILFWGGGPSRCNTSRIPDATPQGAQRLKGGLDRRLLVLRWLHRVGYIRSCGWGRKGLCCGAGHQVSTAPDRGDIRWWGPGHFLSTERRLGPRSCTGPVSGHLAEQSIYGISLRISRRHGRGSRRINSPSITVKRRLPCIPDLGHGFVAVHGTTVDITSIQEIHPVVRRPRALAVKLIIGCKWRWAEKAVGVVEAFVVGLPQIRMPGWVTSIARRTTIGQSQIT